MEYETVKARLQKVFHQVFDDDTIVIFDAMTTDDYDGWDSVSHIMLVLSVEREFGVRFTAAEIESIENVGAMIRLIMHRAVAGRD